MDREERSADFRRIRRSDLGRFAGLADRVDGAGTGRAELEDQLSEARCTFALRAWADGFGELLKWMPRCVENKGSVLAAHIGVLSS